MESAHICCCCRPPLQRFSSRRCSKGQHGYPHFLQLSAPTAPSFQQINCTCDRTPGFPRPLPPIGLGKLSSQSRVRAGEFWRPWIPTQRDAERQLRRNQSVLYSPYGMTEASGKLTQYTHPVRLFWPKSRCYDYLYQEAEALLKNFPVQATISFYEDSDSEDDSVELEQDLGIESDC